MYEVVGGEIRLTLQALAMAQESEHRRQEKASRQRLIFSLILQPKTQSSGYLS